jgi:predicted aspartyl protease
MMLDFNRSDYVVNIAINLRRCVTNTSYKLQIFHNIYARSLNISSFLASFLEVRVMMLNFNRSDYVVNAEIGEVRVQVKLTNAVDEVLVNRGLLNSNQLRMYETQALIDTGAVRTVLPREIVEKLGLRIRGQQLAKYADDRQEAVGLTGPVIIEIAGRETTEAA